MHQLLALWRLEGPRVPGGNISRASLLPGPGKGLHSCSRPHLGTSPYLLFRLQNGEQEGSSVPTANLGCQEPECRDPSAAHITRTRGRSCLAPLHGDLMPPFCTPVSRVSSHTCSQQHQHAVQASGNRNPPGRVICLIPITWAWAELGVPDAAISPGSEGGMRKRKESFLAGERRVGSAQHKEAGCKFKTTKI